jgi:hypothetical protein
MEKAAKKINCPSCGVEIDVNEVLYHQVDEALRKQYADELSAEKQRFKAQMEALTEERQAFEETVASAVKQGIKEKEKQLKAQLRTEMEEAQSERLTALEEELSLKSEQLKAFNKAKSEIERLKREKDELKDAIVAETEAKYSKQLVEAKEKIRKIEKSESELKILEKESIIEQLKNQLQEAQRKAEQGSMQLQGEVQELAIEEWLAEQFPLDTIEEVKKGARGADCLQIVNTRSRRGCGIICYESKRTKNWGNDWIEKLKRDIQQKNADIGVLVTQAMPPDMERLGLRDGVWVCSFEEFKGLSAVLRETIVRLSDAMVTQENKGTKMGMLYDFLTGNEFRMQIEAIVEGFTQMKDDLDSEKRAMEGIWRKRENQIKKVLLNTTYMYGAIKGIAGNALGAVSLLELPSGEEE